MASAFLLAGGLVGLALAPNLILYVAAWAIMGLGMSAGLYDAAFSALGRTYGQNARRHITTLTLFGGFASSLCWPLTSLFLSELGWRGACLAYAGIMIAVGIGLYGWMLPAERTQLSRSPPSRSAPPMIQRSEAFVFALLSASIALAATISTVVSVHLLVILQAQDITLSAAVALGAIVGPSQVGARLVEMIAGRRHHPIWTKTASAILVTLGLALLWLHAPAIALSLVFYGAGIGLESIARANLPLVLFGSQRYAPIMGRIARPSLIAKAAAPSIGAALLVWLGAEGTLFVLAALAALNTAMVAGLFAWCTLGDPPR
jgi:hypothetical protein